jgi:hypothetical protein
MVGFGLLKSCLTVLADHHEGRQEDRLKRNHQSQRGHGLRSRNSVSPLGLLPDGQMMNIAAAQQPAWNQVRPPTAFGALHCHAESFLSRSAIKRPGLR